MIEHKYEVIKQEIYRRNNNKDVPADEDTISICEELTGVSYNEFEC